MKLTFKLLAQMLVVVSLVVEGFAMAQSEPSMNQVG
jgi:hypothetical protein